MKEKDLEYTEALTKRSIQLGLDSKIVLEWCYNGHRKPEVIDSEGMPYTQNDWNCTLITMINVASKQLGNNAKCLIMSLEGVAVVDDNPLLVYSDDSNFIDSFSKHGSLGDYTIYLNRHLSANSVVVVNEEEFLDLDVKTNAALVYIKGLPILSER